MLFALDALCRPYRARTVSYTHVHVALQPSQLSLLPSSHSSTPDRTPSPHLLDVQIEPFETPLDAHDQPRWIVGSMANKTSAHR
jgi:hypothetical protein